jgi:hypothetical protein
MANTENFTHRVAREFTSGDFVHHVGDLVSDADWTPQGKAYVESLGWVVPFAKNEIAAAVVAEIKKDLPAVLEKVVDEVAPEPEPITIPKFVVAPAKKAAKKPVRRPAKP